MRGQKMIFSQPPQSGGFFYGQKDPYVKKRYMKDEENDP